jgi:hypothetical protein
MRPCCTRRKASRHQLYATKTLQRSNQVRLARFAGGRISLADLRPPFQRRITVRLASSNLANKPNIAFF